MKFQILITLSTLLLTAFSLQLHPHDPPSFPRPPISKSPKFIPPHARELPLQSGQKRFLVTSVLTPTSFSGNYEGSKEELQIKLYGILPPPKHNQGYEQSLETLKRKISKRYVVVKEVGKDSEGYILGEVWVLREMLNRALVKMGLAIIDPSVQPEDKIARMLQEKSRENRIGMWFWENEKGKDLNQDL